MSDIIKDKEISDLRRKTFDKMRWGPIFNTVSRVCSTFGGPLLGAGLFAMIGIGQLPAMSLTAWVITGVGVTLSAASMAIDFASTRFYQDVGFDTTEIAAKTNAKLIAQELKENALCITHGEQQEQGRPDGKSWAEVEASKERGACFAR